METHRSLTRSHRYHRRDQDAASESDTTSDSYAEKGDKDKDHRSSKDRERARSKAVEGGSVMSGALNSDDKKPRGDDKKASSSKADPLSSSQREEPEIDPRRN